MTCRAARACASVARTVRTGCSLASIAWHDTPIYLQKRRQLEAELKRFGVDEKRTEWCLSRSSDGSLALHVIVSARLDPRALPARFTIMKAGEA